MDSIGKKIKVVNEVSSVIGLSNVRTMHKRAENINETFDFIVSRAVTNMTDFKKWLIGKFNKTHRNSLNNGIIYLKGGDLTKELKGISHQQYNIADFFEDERDYAENSNVGTKLNLLKDTLSSCFLSLTNRTVAAALGSSGGSLGSAN